MQRPNNLKINDQFIVIKRNPFFNVGDTILLSEDDGSDCPCFWLNADKPSYHSIHFSKLEPYAKTAKINHRSEILLELLQVFNDYDVPLTMTAEQVRDILEDYLTKKE